MQVRHLELTDFRNHRAITLDLEAGVTAVLGGNGVGKTNLVEAVGYLATLASHRVASDQPLVRAGAERAVIRAQVVREDGRSLLVEVEIVPGGTNRARLNRSPVARPREVLGALRSVLFAPEDLAVVKGDPDGRRRLLDEVMTARAPRLAGVRADYDRIVRQRSALLKTAGAARRAGGEALSTLQAWDVHLARAGGELLAGRLDLVGRLQPLVARAYDQVADRASDVELVYRSSAAEQLPTDPVDAVLAGELKAMELAEALLEALGAAREQELDRGVCLVGPHRDDLVLSLGGLPAKGYASHGESWSLALALRLASYDLLASDGAEPVLVLDDVFAELDRDRRDQLAERVAGAGQVLVTAAVEADVPAVLSGSRIHLPRDAGPPR